MTVAHSGTGTRRRSPEIAERVVIRAAEPCDGAAVDELLTKASMQMDASALCEFHPLRQVTLVAERTNRLMALASYRRWHRTGAVVQVVAGPGCPMEVTASLVTALVQVGRALGIASFFTTGNMSLAAMTTACRINPDVVRAVGNPTRAVGLFEAPGHRGSNFPSARATR